MLTVILRLPRNGFSRIESCARSIVRNGADSVPSPDESLPVGETQYLVRFLAFFSRPASQHPIRAQTEAHRHGSPAQ